MSAGGGDRRAEELEQLMTDRAAAFPGSDTSPYLDDVRAELKRVSDWLVDEQTDEGLWPENRINLRFYSDAYGVRALLAAWHLFGDDRYLDAACAWVRYMVKTQRADGGWWVGYGIGDHDWDDPDCDHSVVYVADAGEVSLALVDAWHFLDGTGVDAELADDVKRALLRFGNFTDHFRLRSGAMGLGYTRRDFWSSERVERPYMQAHHQTYPFATAATGANFYAGLSTVTEDPDDWEKAMQSLDWCLEHMGATARQGNTVQSNDNRDIIALHRVGDWVFDCSSAPRDAAAPTDGTPEPRYVDSERQKLYAVWKWMMHVVADMQSDLGEWPVKRNNKPLMCYDGSMRHRLFFLYSLTSYLQNGSPVPGEDDRLREARDRQLWLCAEPTILNEHYGVCMSGVHVMTSGLWTMALAEMVQPGITLPRSIRRLTAQAQDAGPTQAG